MSAVVKVDAKMGANLLAALEALQNKQAVFLALGAMLVTGVASFISLLLFKAHFVLGFLGVLLVLGCYIVGTTAVGGVLMRQAKGLPAASFAEVVAAASVQSLRLLGILFLEMLVFVAIILVVALVLLVCKIPFLGAVLYVVAAPLGVLIAGISAFVLFYVGLPMMLPAVWEGNPILDTFTRLWGIMRRKAAHVVVNLFLLGFLVLFIFGIIFFVLGLGYYYVQSLSGSLGLNGGLQNFPIYLYSSGSSQLMAYASALGASILFMLGFAFPLVVSLKGMCHIYLDAVTGIDFAAEADALHAKVAQAKSSVSATKTETPVEAPVAAAPVAESAPVSPAATPVAAAAPVTEPVPEAAAPVVRTCSACGFKLSAEDVFCSECGTKNPLP